jgi:hypothetical protein
MKKNNIYKYLLIVILSLIIIYLLQKIINKQVIKIYPNNKVELVNSDDFDDITETEYNTNDKTISDLMGLYNNSNNNYYNEDNSDLSRLVNQVNKVFKHLDPQERINLSKRKLDEQYLQELRQKLNLMTDTSMIIDNKVTNVNTGIIFDTVLAPEDLYIGENIRVEIDNQCLDYKDNDKLILNPCDKQSQYLNFKKVSINTPKDFNDNLHPSFSFLKVKEDTIPFAHSIIQTSCDDCDNICLDDNGKFAYDCDICGTDTKCESCCKKYKKCLTIVKNKSNNGYTTFVENCNGRTAQKFYI